MALNQYFDIWKIRSILQTTYCRQITAHREICHQEMRSVFYSRREIDATCFRASLRMEPFEDRW